ncbi:MAG: FHA domain-containing protein [Pirellulales bacterium]|nr:FHA domain-containing protein [Pirellulales bacterium]
MSERSWIIGSLPDCDLQVDLPIVSGRHCRLTERGQAFLLEDLDSRNGTFVAGQRITGPCLVRRGDAVTLGQNVPLPWPVASQSITVGRDASNDVVIALEMVSARHARVERIGGRVFLVDLGSTNGTAINDLANKIARAPLAATDQVFLGTHRLSAAQLLAALPPEPVRAATMLEASPPAALSAALDAAARDAAVPRAPTIQVPAPPNHDDVHSRFRSPISWLTGIAGSVVCTLLILGMAAMSRSSTDGVPPASPGPGGTAAPKVSPAPASPSSAASLPPPVVLSQWPDDAAVLKHAPAVVLLGAQVGGVSPLLSEVKIQGWACASREVICPAERLQELDAAAKEDGKVEATLAFFGPHSHWAVLGYRTMSDAKDGFARVTLESELEGACEVATDISGLTRGTKLSLLAGQPSRKDDPASIEYVVIRQTVERVDRDSSDAPRRLHCRATAPIAEGPVANVVGAPVFDASCRVVGCVQSAGETVIVVPVNCLQELLASPNESH